MGDLDLQQQLIAVLTAAAEANSFQNFSIDLNLGAQKGDGFLGEMYKSTITDNERNKNVSVVIKKAPTDDTRRDATCVALAYKNETYFYSEVLPTLKKFQIDRQVSQIFDNVPKYIISWTKQYQEMIVLEDITKVGFQMREKDLLFDQEHTKFVFETYGRFHAISFCLKDQQPEEYDKLIRSIPENVPVEFGKKKGFSYSMHKIVEKSFKALNPKNDADLCKKFENYATNTTEIYSDAVVYRGKYSGILHGDCWSNNLMFKYNGSKLEDVKLLDFQLLWVGTPVYDLSYFFYSGGCKSLFTNLEDFLDIYYTSFSKVAEELGSDPVKLFPRQALTEDWKKYSKFGMMMALLLTQVRLMSREQAVEVTEKINEETEDKSAFVDAKIDHELFTQRARDILEHMYEIDAL